MKYPRRRFVWVLIAAGAGLAVALGFALRDFVGDYVLTPILFVAWLAQLVYRSIPGWLWWAWFLIIALIVVRRSLGMRLQDDDAPDEGRVPAAGPVQAWTQRLALAHHRNEYFRWCLARDLADISTELAGVLAGRGAAADAAGGEARPERAARLAALDAPPEVTAYLLTGLAAPPARPAPAFERARLRRPRPEPTPLDLDPEQVIAFLEGQTEKRHDD